MARLSEGFVVPPWVSTYRDKIIPPDEERLYVVDDVLNPARDRVVTMLDKVPSSYVVKIFQIGSPDGQLLLVAVPNDLLLDPHNKYPFSLPFLIHLHPTPQDTPSNHRRLFPSLYKGVPDNDIPTFFKDLSGFPFTWDFLFFQFLMNIMPVNEASSSKPTLVGLPAQLKKADQPFVLVIPMVKSFQTGIDKLNSATILEQCLLGIQLAVFSERITVPDGVLPEVEWVSFSAFSIGNEVLDRFVQSNIRDTSIFAQKIREYILFDPPPNNPSNRSNIVLHLARLLDKLSKHVMLYGEDPWYFGPLLGLISRRRISFNLMVEKLFSESALPKIFLAFLPGSVFGTEVKTIVADDPHAVFPSLFMKDAIKRTWLQFTAVGAQKYPDYPATVKWINSLPSP